MANKPETFNEAPVYNPPAAFTASAHVKSLDEYRALYDRSVSDPEGFWAQEAEQRITWFEKWHTVRQYDFHKGEIAWYLGGKLNACYNCVDRHVEAGRGGRYTYHGPGQRVGYVMLDLKERGRDVRCFVHSVEGWVIATLADIGVESWRSEGRIGIWTRDIDSREAKIGAIGVRVRRWVTMHGFSVNLAPDLSHFTGIVPCGIEEFGVTSLQRLGIDLAPTAFDEALRARFGDFLEALEGKACSLP